MLSGGRPLVLFDMIFGRLSEAMLENFDDKYLYSPDRPVNAFKLFRELLDFLFIDFHVDILIF